MDLDRELELLERDLEPLSDREERLLDLDDDDDDDEVLSLRRFFLLGGDCDLDLERLQKNTYKQKPRCTQLIIADGLKCATLLHNIFQQCSRKGKYSSLGKQCVKLSMKPLFFIFLG